MKVLKFGGTSVGTAERIQNLRRIIPTSEPTIVVLSAMAGVTNSLVELTNLVCNRKKQKASEILKMVEEKHQSTCNSLFKSPKFKTKGMNMVKKIIKEAEAKLNDINRKNEKEIHAVGEILSTHLLHLYLAEQRIDSALIPALNFMRIDKDFAPDYFYITEKLNGLLESCRGINTIITQGFVCRNAQGNVDNLHRGGSDFTAAIIGKAIGASEVQIWTDIDGLHNNDPRYVESTQPVRELSFDEAAELAYFGAKILHPASIHPCRERNIPVILKNTLNPSDEGTIISSTHSPLGIKAVAAKDGITAIRIKSLRMLMAYGFLNRIFEIFNRHKTSVDLITTSEVAVTITIDDAQNLNAIANELREFSTVEVIGEQSIICVVGDFLAENPGMASRVFRAIEHIPISQISYGGSPNNITFLVSERNKTETLRALQSIVAYPLTAQPLSHGNTSI